MEDIKESLGITNFGPWYVETLPQQIVLDEIIGIAEFIGTVIHEKGLEEFNSKNINVKFINYGRTQLVFVITVDDSNQYTFLVNQPATKYGIGKNEFDNLIKLNQLNPNLVIKPMYYFGNNKRELYITPYYHRARCIGVNDNKWGVWIPEPSYHFQPFDDNDKKVINTTLISKLISLYDDENEQGISKCRLDGGDFMLLKGYENDNISYDNINNYLKLIAARKYASISLKDYIDRMRIELSNRESNNLIVVGRELRQPFTEEEIEFGIEMGLALKRK